MNPYDCCVANKVVNGKQLTVASHVDDLMISHEDPRVVDAFIEWCRQHYEDKEITAMKPSRGLVHDYLGVIMDYSVPGKLKVSMKDYVWRMVEDFPYLGQVESLPKASTPAAAHLFAVNPKAEKIDKKRADDFHTTVAKGLFLCKRARPDLQPTIPFLCTRVAEPDEDDWKKLLHMLKYMQATKDLVLVIALVFRDGKIVFKWCPDAAFAVHMDMKSHTGACVSVGEGAPCTVSAKQKLNTRSSTEAELVGADDIVPLALWMRLFVEAQGCETEVIIFQDNKSAILLEINGKESSSKRTRHINIRFYFIKDCNDKGFLSIQYCPTDDMPGDYPSKPLQGQKFRKHRGWIMNIRMSQRSATGVCWPSCLGAQPETRSVGLRWELVFSD